MKVLAPFRIFPAVVLLGVIVSTRFPLATVSTTITTSAAKLPVPSRNTNVFGVLRFVPVVAELATLPAVLIVASLVSTIAAAGSTSALTIRELDNNPAALLCTTPAGVKAGIVRVPLTTVSSIDNVSLTARSTTDKLFTHKEVIQFVTVRSSITASSAESVIIVASVTDRSSINASFNDKNPVIDISTIDRSFTQRLVIQLTTVKSVITASLIDAVPVTLSSPTIESSIVAVTVKFTIVAFSITASLADNVPLTARSTTDKFSTHKESMQLATVKSVTERLPIIASAAERVPLIVTSFLNFTSFLNTAFPQTFIFSLITRSLRLPQWLPQDLTIDASSIVFKFLEFAVNA